MNSKNANIVIILVLTSGKLLKTAFFAFFFVFGLSENNQHYVK